MTTSKYLREIVFWGLGIVLAVTPFIVAGNLFFPYIAGKGFFLRFGIEILFAIWIILVTLDRQYMPRWNIMTKAVTVFLTVLALSTALSVNPFRSFWSNYERMEGLVLYLHLIAYFVMLVSVCGTGTAAQVRKNWLIFMNIMFTASSVMVLQGFRQLANPKLISGQSGARVDGTFGNAAYMGVYMLIHVFISLYLLAKAKFKQWAVWLYGGFALFGFIILYYTQTRGSIYGAILGVLLLVALVAYAKGGRSRKIGISVVIAILVFWGGIYLNRDTAFVKNNSALQRFTDISLSSGTVRSRLTIWGMAVEGVKEHPILGYGLDNFNLVFNKYYKSSLYDQEQWFDRAHNVFFDWLTAGGILGLLSYLSLFGVALYLVWKSKEASIEMKAIITGLFAAYFIHNFFVFDNQVSSLLFFTLLAYLYTWDRHGIAETLEVTLPKGSVTSGSGQENKSERSKAVRYSVGIVAALLMIPVAYIFTIKPYTAGATLIKAITPWANVTKNPADFQKNLDYFKQVFALNTMAKTEAREQVVQIAMAFGGNQQIPQEIRTGLIQLAYEQIKKQVEETPNDARYRLFMGMFDQALGQYDAAIAEMTKAVELTPGKQSMRSNLAGAYVQKGDFVNAIKVLQDSYTLDTNNQEAGKALAQAYVSAGKSADAIKTLEGMIAIDPTFKTQGEAYINDIKAGKK